MFEELTVLVEVFDGVGVVGAWAIHELVEVVRQVLLCRCGTHGVPMEKREEDLVQLGFPTYNPTRTSYM